MPQINGQNVGATGYGLMGRSLIVRLPHERAS